MVCLHTEKQKLKRGALEFTPALKVRTICVVDKCILEAQKSKAVACGCVRTYLALNWDFLLELLQHRES